jgi:hypothetical protein
VRADGLTAIGWSSAGGGGDATLSYGATVPATPVNGTLWYDTTATLLKLYTGGTWTTINVSAETIATISGYATTAQSAASTATQKLTEFKAIQVTATTLSAGASATASYNSGTGTITLGVPQGIKGDTGDVTLEQLNTALANVETSLVVKPIITNPTNGATAFTGAIIATYTTASSFVGTQDYVRWEVSTSPLFSTLVTFYDGSSNLLSWTPSIALSETTVYIITPPINNLNYAIILDGKNRRKKIITKRVV